MQQMTTVSNEAALNTAIAQIDAGLNFDGSTAATGTAYTITLSSSFTLSSDIMALALVKGATLTIAGSNSTINGGYTGAAGSGYRGFLVYQGDVTIQNVTIQNTVARGGAGGSFFAADAGGGGAGLGGGLLVASGGVVSLSGVNFSADAAIGGAGGNGGAHGNTGYSGGGGLGGAGGYGTLRGAGGGGGVGQAATGGSPSAQSKPINGGIGILPGGSGGNGVYYGGPASGTGGTYSGGGGFGGGSNGLATKGGGGGGGGLGGNPGSLSNAGTGGAGGWGGGGGGGYEHGGNGGFGGGGGSGYFGGNGGFGGGGGGGGYTGYGGGAGGLGGFGGGKGGGGNSSSGAGGGGLGAGGGVFVEQGGTLIIEAGTLSGGSAVGGAGGANVTTPSVSPGTAGLGFGSGIFIQGNQTVTFSPLSGTTLTINDVIADQTGSGGTGAGNTGAGAISVLGGGTTTLDATNTFTGGVTIAGSSTLDLKANGAAGKSTGIIQFGAGTGDTLRIEAAALPGNSFANLIAGFDGTDTIDLTGLNFVLGSTTAMISGGILTATNGTTTNTLKLGGIADGTHFFANPDATGGTELTICYCAGTSILTAHGEVAVENLAAGDMLVTLSGEAQTLRTLQQVRWIGRRRINLDAHPRPETAAPIRIRRGAFAQNVPHRDLLVSPDHAVLEDGKLICARQLINGTTIRQELGMSVVDYFHVELDTHSILLAEGLPAESYLDTGNRGFFTGSTEPLVLHPDLTDETDCPTREAASCAPFVWDEESVRPVWERLAERAVALGLTPPPVHTTSDSQVCVSTNGQTLRPIFVGDGLYLFLLPSGTNEVRLISRASAPTDVQPWLEDRRRLGVYVERIVVRGGDDVHETPVDHPGLTEGWWAAEGSGMTLRRWTNGSAVLPLPSMDGPAVLEIRASNGGMPYLVDGDRQHRAA